MLFRKILIAVALLVGMLTVFSLSCSVNGPEVPMAQTGASLEGKVYYGDSVVTNSMIIVVFQGSNPGSSISSSDDEGNYKVENAPLGKVIIGVNSEAAKGKAFGAAMATVNPLEKGKVKKLTLPKVSDVPKKYHEPDTSGISTEIKSGKNEFDIRIPK
jgi:hypothetical protein